MVGVCPLGGRLDAITVLLPSRVSACRFVGGTPDSERQIVLGVLPTPSPSGIAPNDGGTLDVHVLQMKKSATWFRHAVQVRACMQAFSTARTAVGSR